MECTGCKTAHAQHELRQDKCLDCLVVELDRVNAAAAAMRQVLEVLDSLGGLGFDKHGWIRTALSTTAGTGYVKRQDVKVLVEALEFVCDWGQETQKIAWVDMMQRVREALTHAKAKGLL